VELLGPHPGGGHRVAFDLATDTMDAFIELLEEHDWMFVF
jgi:hypothetical protein